MGIYSSFARLTHLSQSDGIITSSVIQDYDGAVVWLGDGNNMSTVCDKQLDVIYKAGKPTIGFYTWRFDYTANMSFNQVAWPNAANDPYMKNLTRAMMSGTVQRKYSALMIDVSNTNQTSTVYLADQWVRDFAIKHLTDMVYKAFHIPVYIYFTPSAYKRYKSNTGETGLPYFFKNIPPDGALSTVVFSTTGTDGFPVDTASPVKDSSGNLILDTGYWWFWLYASRPRPTWLYYGSKSKLYSEIGFTPSTTTDPGTGTTPTPTPTPTTPDLTSITAAITALQTAQADTTAQLAALKTKLDSIVNSLHNA
jgi:hypothetical protein